MDKKSLPLKPESYKRVDLRSFPMDLRKRFRPENEVANKDIFVRYKAYHLQHHKPVALTILKKISKIHMKRITGSLKILEKINQPNILPIIEHGPVNEEERYYWATPYTVPINWDDVINSKWSDSEFLGFIIDVFSDLLGGLRVAHKHNIIHEMIQPDLIFLYDDKLCFSDFDLPISSSAVAKLEDIESVQTIYTAPEIIEGKRGDARTDLYSIGVLLRELVSQSLPRTSRKSVDKSNGSTVVRFEFPKHTTFSHLHEYTLQLTKTNPDERFESVEVAITAFEDVVNLEKTSLGEKPTKIEILDEIKREPVDNQIDIEIESMPVLSKTISEINPSAFRDVVILHINHCLEDIFKLNDALCLLVDDLIFVAVPYGSQQVPQSLPYTIYYPFREEGGFKLYRNGQLIKPTSYDFDNAMTALVSQALEVEVIRYINKGKKILIIEDGGYHYNILHELNANTSKFRDGVIGVIEQTTSGVIRCVRFLKTADTFYPVLTVARSDIKMRMESYFIGRRVVDELNYLLYEFNDFLSFHNIVIIGYGIIGRSITKCLDSMNCKISVVDIDKETSSLAKKEGYNVYDTAPKDFFEGTPIIIGATGESSFTYSMLSNFLENSSSKMYLASASSKRVEFADLIEFFEGSHETRKEIINSYPALKRINDIQIESNQIGLAYHFKYCNKNKSIILVARGFPVNFYRPGSISLTHSMIDPVNAEIVLLAQHLALYSKELKNELYLLGNGIIPYLDLNEEELISTWIEYNKLSVIEENGDVWSNLNIHPLEKKLRVRCINEYLISKGI